MSTQITPRLLKGFRDSLPDYAQFQAELRRKLTAVCSSFGLQPIDTPILEYADILLGKSGGETDKQMYRFIDHGKRDVALRFDLTVPLARFMAQHHHTLPLPFRCYHFGKVFRGENTQRGRYREFEQFDFDIIGVDSAVADFEIILMIIRMLEAIDIENFTIHISDRKLLLSFLHSLGIDDDTIPVLRTIDKLRKVGMEKTKETLCAIAGEHNGCAIIEFLHDKDISARHGGDRLQEIMAQAHKTNLAHRLEIDPTITRGLDYYTGVVFETFLEHDTSSICSGGRYNDLTSVYSSTSMAGVGASIGLDRLHTALIDSADGENSAQTAARQNPSYCDAMIFCVEEKLAPHYQMIAEQFRTNGLRSTIYPTRKKIGDQFTYAERLGALVAIICDTEEAAAHQRCTLRTLGTSTQDKAGKNHDNITIEEAIALSLQIKKRKQK